MNWLTNEVLFYGGIIACGIVFILAIFYFCFSKIKFVKLNSKLDDEYGSKASR